MATTSHGLSVFMNTCIKNPLHSSATRPAFQDNTPKQTRLVATDPGPYNEQTNGFSDSEEDGFDRSLPLRASLEQLETQLKGLQDDEFYLELRRLKDANRKTLEECEALFREKYGRKNEGGLGEVAAKQMVEEMFAARLAARSGLVEHHSNDLTNGYTAKRTIPAASKPPLAPGTRRENALLKTSPQRNNVYASPTVHRPRTSSAPARSQFLRRSYSLDDDDWKRAMQASTDVSDDEVQSEGPLDPDVEAAVTRISNMWRGFKVSDYLSNDRRHSASSVSRRKQAEKEDIANNWRHRITIPKPFQMSLRDASKIKTKSRAQQELEEQRLEKMREEEEECQKKFKAQPAPAHIYLPLYDELKEKDEARRRYVKHYSKELLKSQEKPFNFVKREEEKKQQRIRSATVAERIAHSAKKAQNKKEKFVAKPVPEFVYSSAPREKLMEEEEYRKIRIKMRARELLRESALPPNMEANQRIKEQKEKEKLMKSKQKSQNKRRPRSAHQVPDYDHLYREFQKELARHKQTKAATMVEPFDLETNRLQSNRERILKDMERDDKLMRDTARATPRRSLGYLSSSMDSIPFKLTNSAELRTGYFRSLKEREARREEQQQEEDRRRKLREGKLRKYITERSGDTPRVEDVLKQRLKHHKEADSARLEQYERDIEEMRSRVEKRPLLFERETQVNAGKAAEKKFKTTLKSAGIDEDFVHTRSSTVPSAHSDDNYEDDYEVEN